MINAIFIVVMFTVILNWAFKFLREIGIAFTVRRQEGGMPILSGILSIVAGIIIIRDNFNTSHSKAKPNNQTNTSEWPCEPDLDNLNLHYN